MNKLYGGIEAGGTKIVCAVGNGPGNILAEVRFPTGSPSETIKTAIDFFRAQEKLLGRALAGLGIAAFGPLDPDPSSRGYGYITSTPKPGWRNTDLVGPLRAALGIPVAFDTDVNGAALAETRWGAARGLDTVLYLTVGTGIGGGGLVGGRLMHGLIHPEMGHIRVPHDTSKDPFPGVCPYHGDCLEGLAAGPAIEKRWGVRAENLPADHPAWLLEAEYLALGLHNYICTLSPQLIILGGGVMSHPELLVMVRKRTISLLSDYVQATAILERIDRYIVLPALGNQAGVLGAFALAMQESEDRRPD